MMTRTGLAIAVLISVTTQINVSWAEKARSLSIGNASNGSLLNSSELAAIGDHHRVMNRTLKRGLNYGTDELVRMLLKASKHVARQFPNSVLWVGNLSKKKGGDLAGSVSHNSGRDADIPFYVTNMKGKVLPANTFIRFNSRGHAGKRRFDVPRNWAFVKACLTNETIQIQWMFIAHPLRKLLLDYAKKTGESEQLIKRASDVLGQPGNSSAHAEHFHIRLYCAKHERLQGCLNYGTIHSWSDNYADDIAQRVSELTQKIPSRNTRDAVAAIQKIAAIRGHSGVSALGRAVGDSRDPVRRAAVTALGVLKGAETTVTQLIAAARKSTSTPWKQMLINALVKIGDPTAAPLFLDIISASDDDDLQISCAKGLGQLLHTNAVPTLAAGLSHDRRTVRRAYRSALIQITNHNLGTGRRASKKWQRWWKKNKNNSRTTWVKKGFRRHYRIAVGRKLTKNTLEQLIPLIEKGGGTSFNVRSLIKTYKGYWINPGHFSDRQLFRFYNTWLKSGAPAQRDPQR